MNRIEYMTKLASLLQDIPEIERKDAMKYYNDYFDEAGEENEEQVIREFGTPEEVAKNIKADLKDKTVNTTDNQQGQNTSYQYHTQNQQNQNGNQQNQTNEGRYQAPGGRYQMNDQTQKKEQSSDYQYEMPDDRKKKNDRIWKIILLVILAIIIGPVLLSVVGGILLAGLGIVLSVIVGVAALVIAGVTIAIVGISLVISGFIVLLPQTAAGLALMGSGLIILVLGVVATVGFGKLCALIFCGIAKGIKYLWGKIFHRKRDGKYSG